MTKTTRAILKFNTNAGEVVRLSIPRARMDKTAEGAATSMEAILSTNAVVINGSIPSSVRGAELLQTRRTVIV